MASSPADKRALPATPRAGGRAPAPAARRPRAEHTFLAALAASIFVHLVLFLGNPFPQREAQGEVSDRDIQFFLERVDQAAAPAVPAAEVPPAPEPEPQPEPETEPVPAPAAEEPPTPPAPEAAPLPAPTALAAATPEPADERFEDPPIRFEIRPPPADPQTTAHAAVDPTQSAASRLDPRVLARKLPRPGPRADAKDAPAPARPTAADVAPLLPGKAARYVAIARQRIIDHLILPPAAARGTLHGYVLVQVTIARSGRVRDCHFLQRSSHAELDEAAHASVRRAAPFPSLEGVIDWEYIKLNVPFQF
ncbi:MAG: TonB family protein [Planctomycetes bacterium]|nr:TonB family protein [Planctomycetota bacterium]